MHKKISEMPKEWPLPRKGRKYIAIASHNPKTGIPIVFALRDILKIARTRREVRKICLEGKVIVNGKSRKDIAFPIQLKDVLQLKDSGKNYVLMLKNNKLELKEISQKDSNRKIVKIRGKVLLSKDKIQVNLQDGNNFLFNKEFSCGDSAVLDLKENKISSIIPLKKGSSVEVIGGKHIGLKGKVINEVKEGEKIVFELKLEEKGNVLLGKRFLLAIE